MFVVWRKRAITTDRPVELFVEYDRVGKGRKKARSFDTDAWLWERRYCRHTGPGRVTWTALLMHAERVGGRPRQRLIHRFPALRSCCLQDSSLVAGWWHVVRQALGCWEEQTDFPALESFLIRRDKKAILCKLEEIVPPASRTGRRAFNASRRERQAEKDCVEKQYQEARRLEAERSRQEEERRKEEEERRRRQAQDRPAGSWWDVLGVSPVASWDDIQRRYRALAMEHHPDRGGEAKVFLKVQAAYELARAAWEGR
jgi:hypothetical protein